MIAQIGLDMETDEYYYFMLYTKRKYEDARFRKFADWLENEISTLKEGEYIDALKIFWYGLTRLDT